jgi:hypothetical protein
MTQWILALLHLSHSPLTKAVWKLALLEGIKDLDSASHHTGRSGVGLGCAGNHRASRMRYLPQSFAEKKIIPLRQPLSFQFRHECFRLRHESLFFHVEFHGRF